MRMGLFLLFMAVPLIELALLIRIGQAIGFWPTIGLVVASALAGATILHRQGLQTVWRINKALESGQPPIKAVVDGMFLVLSGALLLTPGILTDITGMLLLIPAVRTAISKWGLKRLFNNANIHVTTFGSTTHEQEPPRQRPSAGARPPSAEGPVIDGEYERVDETEKPANSNKPRRDH